MTMNLRRKRELLLEKKGDRILLKCPGVGLFTLCSPPGWLLSPGEPAGVVKSLEVPYQLVVPEGAVGRVVSQRPPLVHQPVGFGDVLYELEPITAEDAAALEQAADVSGASGNVVTAPHAGRFWHRPSPDEPSFCEVGTLLEEGRTVGLIEVMKTFTHLPYRAAGNLPTKAKITRVLVGDGDEVEEGQALVEVEPS